MDWTIIKIKNVTHWLSAGGEGAEVVYPLRSSSTLPSMILNEIGERGQIKRKYYQRVLPEDPTKDYYYIMRETPNTTALLIEYGFIDNPRDQRKLQNNLLDYAEGVVEAVSNYIGINYTPPGEMVPDTEGLYTVKRGDTLYSIARQYNISVDELKNLNGLTSNILTIGQTLRVPSFEVPEIPDTEEYIVQSGDTLYSIANRFNISVNDLISYNNLPTTILSINQVLRIPRIGPSNILYTVKRGDTLYSIASSYGTTIDAIKQLNNLTNNDLSIGQELYIPEGTIIGETDFIVYEVVRGDTLYSIARKFNTSVDAIRNYNNLTSDTLTISQILQIPVEEIQTENTTYTVKRGDTLYSIANNFRVTVSEIMNLNNMTSTLLSIGQTLLIPNRTTDF